MGLKSQMSQLESIGMEKLDLTELKKILTVYI